MPQRQTVIFDLYGTLIDCITDEDRNEIFDNIALLFQYYGASVGSGKLRDEFNYEKRSYLLNSHEKFPELDLEAVFYNLLRREGIGNPFLAAVCCKMFRIISRRRFQLFLDTIPVLTEMQRRGFALGMVSNAQRVFTKDEIRLLGLNSFFRCMVLSTDYGFAKPDPRLFSVACSLLNVSPSNAVYVGDSPENDVAGGKQIGMKTVLISRTLKSVIPGAEPDYYATDLWDAWEWIQRLG